MKKHEAIALFALDGKSMHGVSRLAKALGISSQAVSQWDDDEPIPDVHRLKIQYELRPDAFRSRKGAA